MAQRLSKRERAALLLAGLKKDRASPMVSRQTPSGRALRADTNRRRNCPQRKGSDDAYRPAGIEEVMTIGLSAGRPWGGLPSVLRASSGLDFYDAEAGHI